MYNCCLGIELNSILITFLVWRDKKHRRSCHSDEFSHQFGHLWLCQVLGLLLIDTPPLYSDTMFWHSDTVLTLYWRCTATGLSMTPLIFKPLTCVTTLVHTRRHTHSQMKIMLYFNCFITYKQMRPYPSIDIAIVNILCTVSYQNYIVLI